MSFGNSVNRCGADVYMPYDCTLQPGKIAKAPLDFGIEVPDGYTGYVFPRSSMAVKGLVCELPLVDFGYCGKIVGYNKRRAEKSGTSS